MSGDRRTLWLLRHAKSSWSEPGLDDAARPLTARGERAAGLIGLHLAQRGAAPGVALCSPARRACETLTRVAAQLRSAPELRLEPAIYGGSWQALLTAIQAVESAACELLLVGHEPGVPELADALVGRDDVDARRRLQGGFPTAALAEIGFEVSSWAAVGPGQGELLSFCRPKDLV